MVNRCSMAEIHVVNMYVVLELEPMSLTATSRQYIQQGMK